MLRACEELEERSIALKIHFTRIQIYFPSIFEFLLTLFLVNMKFKKIEAENNEFSKNVSIEISIWSNRQNFSSFRHDRGVFLVIKIESCCSFLEEFRNTNLF